MRVPSSRLTLSLSKCIGQLLRGELFELLHLMALD